MDWARAIEINQAALTRIVAALIAMVGLARGGAVTRLAHPIYRAVSRLLGPAESAVRRLIVIAARGLEVKLSSVRPMPEGLAFAGKGSGCQSFQLFDARKRFNRARRTSGVPRIRVLDFSPLVPLFQPRPVESPVREPDDSVGALRLVRRLLAVKMALENLPRQVKRLKRWQARRDRMASPKFRSPLRPGPPPGHRKEPKDDIDWVLKECHALAWDALDSS